MNNVKVSTRRLSVGFKGIRTRADQNSLGWEYSPETYNFAYEDGALTGGLGIDAARGFFAAGEDARWECPHLPEGVYVSGMFVYQRRSMGQYDDRLVVHTTKGELYYIGIFKFQDVWHKIEDCTINGTATAISYNYDGKDVLLISSPESPLCIIDDATVKQVTNAPRLSSLAVHYERVYGTYNGTRNEVWFSDDFNPENWNVSSEEGGYITFADECGECLAVVSFLNYLYIFRERGIFRLTAYGDQQEFSLKKLFIGAGYIYKNTIALCGDRIMFLADDGMHVFDGYDVSDAVPELPELMFKRYCRGAYHDNHYYLACFSLIPELSPSGMRNDLLVRYDLRDGSMEMLAGYDVVVLGVCNVHHASDLLIATADNVYGNRIGSLSDSGKVYGTPTRKVYKSPYGDLGSGGFKTVRSIDVTTESDVDIIVVTDGKRHTFRVKGSGLPQTVFVGKSGRKIAIELHSEQAECKISPLVLKVDFM